MSGYTWPYRLPYPNQQQFVNIQTKLITSAFHAAFIFTPYLHFTLLYILYNILHLQHWLHLHIIQQ